MSTPRLALIAAGIALVVASCSATVGPPPATSTTKTTKTTTSSPPPPPSVTGPLQKDWKTFGGTAYFGCPEKFTQGASALEEIRPKVFDTKTGQYLAASVPTPPAGEPPTGASCALTGTAEDMRVVYILTTEKTTTAYAFGLKASQPSATKELQPPSPGLKLTAPAKWHLAPTASGVAWIDAFTDGHVEASPPRTVILSRTDLSTTWSDPQPGQVWQDVLAFQRDDGVELRQPSGEVIYQDKGIATVDGELSDGPDKLVKITRRDPGNPPVMSTSFYDLNAKSLVKVGDSDRISGGGLSATLSDGKLFVDGRTAPSSQFGLGVWNLRTQRWDVLKTRYDAQQMSIAKLAFFEDHLYITHTGNTFAVLALPAPEPVSTTWSVRPFARISGWTLVCRGENAAGGDCKDIVMVQNHDDHFLGPWF